MLYMNVGIGADPGF